MAHIILSSSFQARFNLSVHINIKVVLPVHRLINFALGKRRNNTGQFQKTWLLRDEEIS